MNDATDTIDISVLGSLTAHRGGVDVTPTAHRERMILALLTLDEQHTVSVHRLLESLWGQDAPPTARNSIQVAVSRLRQRIDLPYDEPMLVTTPEGYSLRGVTVDSSRFAAWYRDIVGRAQDATVGDEQLVADIRVALAMWRDRHVLIDLQTSIDVLVPARQLERRRVELVELLGTRLLELAPRDAVDAVEHDAHHDWSRPGLQVVYLQALVGAGLRRDARRWCDHLEQEHAADSAELDQHLRELIAEIRGGDAAR